MNFDSVTAVNTAHRRLHQDRSSGSASAHLRIEWMEAASRAGELHARNRLTIAILKLKQRNENWDGYGSAAANRESVGRAISIVPRTISDAIQASGVWLEPHAGLNEEGFVSLEWWKGDKKLTLYIAPQCTEYVISWGVNIDTEMQGGFLEEHGFPKLWKWLVSTRG